MKVTSQSQQQNCFAVYIKPLKHAGAYVSSSKYPRGPATGSRAVGASSMLPTSEDKESGRMAFGSQDVHRSRAPYSAKWLIIQIIGSQSIKSIRLILGKQIHIARMWAAVIFFPGNVVWSVDFMSVLRGELDLLLKASLDILHYRHNSLIENYLIEN